MTDPHISRELIVESLKRGNAVEIDLDTFAANDNGKCRCALCLTVRSAVARGERGTGVVYAEEDVLMDPELLRKL